MKWFMNLKIGFKLAAVIILLLLVHKDINSVTL
jgi:hypothetical protein